MSERLAVVLFNLGGPDRPEAVQPFLFNLFNDPAIINLPQPLRWAIAKLISTRRAPVAQKIYEKLGGGSPLLANTEAQAGALQESISANGNGAAEIRCFIAMRYWHPLTEQTVADVQAWNPDRILLLPLYPQYSTTTTESSIRAWRRTAAKAKLSVPTKAVCCYPVLDGFVAASAGLLRQTLRSMKDGPQPRVLFSAHGLPQKVIDRGDPYQYQVERTAAAIVAALPEEDFDWTVCYQSRVGPLAWIEPYTEDEIRRAGVDGVPLIVMPIAFVSEHSETLVELDIEYRELAEEAGVPGYERVPTVSNDPVFIGGLAKLVDEMGRSADDIRAAGGKRICTADRQCCGYARLG
jgi:protoporphyrin/coproporphyrin ferrochelatase